MDTASNPADEPIVRCIYEAIEELNLGRDPGDALALALETRLLGEPDGLDSLGFVNFIVALEDQIQSAFGQHVPLIDSAADPELKDRFATVRVLATHLSTVLAKAS